MKTMYDRTKIYALALVTILVLVLSTVIAHRAAAQGEIRIDPNASCTTACHTDFAKKKHIHAVAASGQSCSGLCHQPVEKGRHVFKPLPANRNELCGMCHQQTAKAHPHVPVKAGLCTTCHDPHQSDHARLLKKPAPELCQTCHQSKNDKAHVHVPVKAGMCTTCHEHHQSDHARLLKKPAPELCQTCHQSRTDKAHSHQPVKAGMCTTCHNPHQSDQGKLLTQASPQLCFTCHDAQRFQGKVVHGPVAEGKCLGCHAPHSAEHKALLGKTGQEFCFTCHAAALKDRRGQTLPATKALFEDKKATLHPPFAAGQCTFCHQPHASESGRLMSKPYPDGMYATYAGADTYGVCFTCHAAKAFEEARTLTDTGFRNGNLNLHFRHVNREKGRACGACHNPHGSPQAKLIDTAFQFGTRNLGLKFDKTDTGGSCSTACHGQMKYDRCLPEAITLRTSPRQGKDATAEELLASCEKELAKIKDKAKETTKK